MAALVRRIEQFLFCCSWGVHALIAFDFLFILLLGPAGDPQSPPKLVRPFQEVETFDRNVSNKIHKNLVTKKHSSKEKQVVTARSHIMSDSKTLICPLIASDVIVAAMNQDQ
jgi:hypothetical protein